MVSDGFQNSEEGFVDPRERACRKSVGECICSESNVWTRWRCRRCSHDIPAGLRGKYRQAIAARTGEWSTGSSTSSGEEDRKSKKMEAENEGESGMEEEWRMDMDVEKEIESCKKLDEQKRKLQKELREIEKSLVLVERGSGKPQVTCSSNCTRWRKGSMTSCQSTR